MSLSPTAAYYRMLRLMEKATERIEAIGKTIKEGETATDQQRQAMCFHFGLMSGAVLTVGTPEDRRQLEEIGRLLRLTEMASKLGGVAVAEGEANGNS